jgi:hypothetical protein
MFETVYEGVLTEVERVIEPSLPTDGCEAKAIKLCKEKKEFPLALCDGARG